MIRDWYERIKNKVMDWFGKQPEHPNDAAQSTIPPSTPSSAPNGTAAMTEHARQQASRAISAMGQPDPAFQRLYSGYAQVKFSEQDGTPAGYAKHEGYPTAFQANEFPKLAGNGTVNMLGANQAFYFTRTSRDASLPLEERVQLDDSKLREMMSNVYDNQTRFTLMFDADAVHNHERFREKYLGLRKEPDAAPLQWRENELIADYMTSGNYQKLAHEVVTEKNKGRGLTGEEINRLTEQFLQNNFAIVLVETEKALDGAYWEVDGPEGKLCAKQLYTANTRNTDRTFLLATEPELDILAQQDTVIGQNAKEIRTGIDAMHVMKKAAMQAQGIPQQQGPHVAALLNQRGSGQDRRLG